MRFDAEPASDYPVPDLVELLNLGFENYFVPIQFSVPMFLTMLRKDGIDLTASRVLLAEEQPSGLALIARRGWTSRLAAMGISHQMRGKGAGSWLMEKLIHEAGERNDREMVLEVIEQNEPAVRLYEKYGFQILRRLIGLVRNTVAAEGETSELQELDLREMGRLVSQHGLPDLPWQLSGETIGQLTPPARAYRNGKAYVAISNPDAQSLVIWSLLVEPDARGNGLGSGMLRQIVANDPGKAWHVPAIYPEEFGKVFERVGFEREELSQWQMRLTLT